MKIKWIIILSVYILLSGCSPMADIDVDNDLLAEVTSLETAEYEIVSEYYCDGNITICYPQIDFANDADEFIINKLIMDEIFSMIDEYDTDYTHFDAKFETKLMNNNLASFLFKGVAYAEDAAYPVNVFHTITIDLKNAAKIRPMELIDVHQTFIDFVKEESRIHLKEEQVYFIEQIPDERFLEMLAQSDQSAVGDTMSKSEIFTYLTEESLGVVIGTIHVLGDYVEVNVPYELIRFGNNG